ncbi:conserved unknown protein [Ectocarpus siliculosus]|uniref:HECT domain-containing protein n=1 Tax=Ectocarpus siliculosus TaxID=2880 RepID=D7FSE4_ECTSI|nr:conserved unknown protein [Ectocarpus siliculosus]|eukprot:CBJ31085.1 conserved unknown protein [Ectocarpus siliculosus]
MSPPDLSPTQLFDQSSGMFVPAGEKGRVLWFNKDCVRADEEYGLVGLLVGLAVYSGVILDVPLPLMAFKQILGEQLSLEGCAGRRRLFFFFFKGIVYKELISILGYESR